MSDTVQSCMAEFNPPASKPPVDENDAFAVFSIFLRHFSHDGQFL